jgi:type IV pilus assembly protein PilV
MAKNDLFELQTALATALPRGIASIEVATNLYTITINWDENRDGATNNSDPNFTMSFEL